MVKQWSLWGSLPSFESLQSIARMLFSPGAVGAWTKSVAAPSNVPECLKMLLTGSFARNVFIRWETKADSHSEEHCAQCGASSQGCKVTWFFLLTLHIFCIGCLKVNISDAAMVTHWQETQQRRKISSQLALISSVFFQQTQIKYKPDDFTLKWSLLCFYLILLL